MVSSIIERCSENMTLNMISEECRSQSDYYLMSGMSWVWLQM